MKARTWLSLGILAGATLVAGCSKPQEQPATPPPMLPQPPAAAMTPAAAVTPATTPAAPAMTPAAAAPVTTGTAPAPAM